MTCILSMPALYTNPFNEGDEDIQNKRCESFDLHWINVHHPHSGLSDNQRFSDSCQVETSKSLSIPCRMEISNGLTTSVKSEHSEKGYEKDNIETDSEKHVPTNGKHNAISLSYTCKETEVGLDDMNVNPHGVKRKAITTESGEVYMPSKRVSPFLNTPKQRRDERKKILEISIKKLRQLDDPEAFLRRTVLINNVTKCLQKELRQEKYGTKPFSRCGVFNNNCMSDTYLFDDPFLSGVHEKITDDMTDTLINNVFYDKLNGKVNESDIGEKSDIEVNEMEVADELPRIQSRTCSSLKMSEDNSNQSFVADSITVTQSSQKCSRLTCLDSTSGTKEMYPGRCDDSSVANSCCINKSAEKYKPIFNNKTGNIGERDSKAIENIRSPSSELGKQHSDQNTECDKVHAADIVRLRQSIHILVNCADTAQKYLSTDRYNSHLASKGAINENNCNLDHLELDQNLDQKSLSHSFSSFLSAFDISDSI
ncbi:uncharacterized protein LOC123538237 [Mercenaria mercenaria]|uniref:uncharacterized protein LOC123538237 n=1 Tax=Mercenaria mercenaria TaxID=6596 RepID=UPI00234E8F8E|nr:uncharacterized protein LOC123538237 [Mercenaria mercenaria]